MTLQPEVVLLQPITNEQLEVWAHRLVRVPGTYLSLRHPITKSLRAQWHVDVEDDEALPQVAQTFLQLHDMKLARNAYANISAAYRKPPWRVL